MVARRIDLADGAAIQADSSLAAVPTRIIENLEAVVADRPLMSGSIWHTQQRWSAPWPVVMGPFVVGYSDTPIGEIAVHLAHAGRVSSRGESTPEAGAQRVWLHPAVWRGGVGGAPEPPPRDTDDWDVELDSDSSGSVTLTAPGRGETGWILVGVWVLSELAAAASHTRDLEDHTRYGALIIAATSIATPDIERLVVIRPRWSASKAPVAGEEAGIAWAQHLSPDTGDSGTEILVVTPPSPAPWAPPEPSWGAGQNDVVDLWPMGVARIDGLTLEARPAYAGPTRALVAPDEPARALGPRSMAAWLRDRHLSHWRPLTTATLDRGASLWGRRRLLTTSWQTMVGDGGVLWAADPHPITFRAIVGVVSHQHPQGRPEPRVDVRIVIHEMPPAATVEAEGDAVRVELATRLRRFDLGVGLDGGALDHSLWGITEWGGQWSSRGALWPQATTPNPVDDWDGIQWLEVEVTTSAAVDRDRVVRPEIRLAGAGTNTRVWWLCGGIVWRHDVDDPSAYLPAMRPFTRGRPILGLEDLAESAETHWIEQTPVVWSAWPDDDNPWRTTSADDFEALTSPARIRVLPHVATIVARITARRCQIQWVGGGSLVSWGSTTETKDVPLAVTASDAGSTLASAQLEWRRAMTQGQVYGLTIFQVRPSALPDIS